ncbi:GNAT family N-acetyltransferase [Streptomyces glaucosporus]|uniref:GNAT family N-acetyltransferase n=1 Tax=Streptomyces glaucosporus TaxID=284044 RepID=UPI0031DE4D20
MAMYTVRIARADEWRRIKELRLEALADPIAPVAFLERYEKAVAYPDSTWQQRAAEGERQEDKATFVGEAADGQWGGMLTVLVEGDRTQLVGVYMRPEHRGTGLAAQLFEAAREWSWARPEVRGIRLYVHENNHRAAAFYRRQGFQATGGTDSCSSDPDYEMELLRASR